jgi:hypothetical protein
MRDTKKPAALVIAAGPGARFPVGVKSQHLDITPHFAPFAEEHNVGS